MNNLCCLCNKPTVCVNSDCDIGNPDDTDMLRVTDNRSSISWDEIDRIEFIREAAIKLGSWEKAIEFWNAKPKDC